MRTRSLAWHPLSVRRPNSEVHLRGCAKSDELVILRPSSAALSSRLRTSTARLSSTAGFPAAAATPRSEGLGGGTRISRGGVVDAFTRDLEPMEVIAAADAVVNARVDLEDAEDWLARAFS
jgi:hypothetical protein